MRYHYLRAKEFFKKNALGGQHMDMLQKVENGEIEEIKSMLSPGKPLTRKFLWHLRTTP